MNNLKRVLSLALSGIMLVGMMAMGASAADFTDADKIQHDDAVNILVALKVINGQDDGSFNPEGDVTRGQMAKMIAVAMNGGNEANTGVKGTPTFTDIKGHWAESYIEYCADLGIISGRGDGTFDPDGNVTGLEATKMVLTALGYDATAYKLTGATWAVRTDELARQADPNLYEELATVSMATKASRDTAAQLIWNGLQNTTRRVTPSTNTNTGEVTWLYDKGDMMLYERYNARIWVGTFDGNDKCIDGLDAGSVQVSGHLSNATATVNSRGDIVPVVDADATFPSTFDISNIGEKVKVIFRDGGNSIVKNVPDKKDVIYGVFNTGETQVIESTRGGIGDLETDEQKLKIDGTKYNLADTVKVYVNYIDTETGTTYGVNPETGANLTNGIKGDKDAEENSDLTNYLKAVTGDTIKFVCDDDGKICAAYIVDSDLAVVVSKNSEKVGINNGVGTIKIADNDIYDDVAVNDVVKVTTLYKSKATTDGAYTIVTKAEKVTGEVEGYKTTTDDDSVVHHESVTLDDKTYKIYGEDELFVDGLDNDAEDVFEDAHIGEDFDLYMVNGYVRAAIQVSESASNYSVITDIKGDSAAGGTFDALQLQVMDGEGTKTIITVSDDTKFGTGDDKHTATDEDFTIGDIVTYTTKNGEATVKIVADVAAYAEDTHEGTGYTKSTKSFNGTVTSTDCVLFVSTSTRTDSDSNEVPSGFKAYNIRSLGDVKLVETINDEEVEHAWGVAYNKDNDKVVAAYVDLGHNPKGATSSTVYGIVSNVGSTVKVDGDPYTRYTVQSNGKSYTVNVSTSSDDEFAKGDLVFFDPTSDNTYGDNDVKKLDKNTATIEGNDVVIGFVGDYDKSDAIITIYQTLTKTETVKGDTTVITYSAETENAHETYAIDKDAAIYYIDKKGNASPDAGSISKFDRVNGYVNAVAVVDDDTVVVLLVEIGNEKHLVSKDGLYTEGE